MDLDLLCCTLSDEDVLIPLEVVDDVFRKLISSSANTLIGHNSGQCNDRNLCSSSPDIDDHVSNRFFHIESYAQCRSHRFENEEGLFGIHVIGRIKYCPLFYFCDSARNTDHHFEVRKKTTLGTDHIDHPFDHIFSSLKIGNYAILQWTNRFNELMGLFMHLHGTIAHG